MNNHNVYPVTRISLASLAAIIITFTLFILMQYLIRHSDSIEPIESEKLSFIDFVRIKPVEPPLHDGEEKTPEFLEAPPPPLFENNDELSIDEKSLGIIDIKGPGNLPDGGIFGPGTLDNDLVSIVKPQPVYPGTAVKKGIEGHVIVEYTVTAAGTTANIRIISSQPTGIFDRPAIRATSKFKYKPKIVNGKAVEVSGIRNKFTFELEE